MNSQLSTKDRSFIAITFFYIIYTIFPLFADITGIPIYITAMALVFVLLMMYPKAFMEKPTKWFIAYIGVLVLYTIFGKPIFINGVNNQSLTTIYRITIEVAWILPNITIMNVLLYKNDGRLFKIIGYGSIILLVASFLYLLPLVSTINNVLRSNIHEAESVRPVGLPGYDLMHAYTFMILPLCLLIKNNTGKMKILYLIALLLFAYFVIKTAITTGIVILLVTILFACFFNVQKIHSSIFIFISIFLIGYLLYQSDFFLNLIDVLMPYFEDTAVSNKLEDLRTSMIQGEVTGGSFIGRMDYHQISKEAFWNNPFLGSNKAGGHSKILDILGAMGIFVFIPYFMILCTSLKKYIFRIKDIELKSYLCFSFILASIYLYTKGIFGSPGYLFMLVIVPSIIFSVNSLKNK